MHHNFLVVTVKKGLKSVYIYRSYYKNKLGGPFFWTTLYTVVTQQRVAVHCWYTVAGAVPTAEVKWWRQEIACEMTTKKDALRRRGLIAPV